MALSGPGGSVSGSVDYDSASRTATFTPGAALAASTTYTANVSGAKDLAGNTMTRGELDLHHRARQAAAARARSGRAAPTPAVAADPDNGGVEIGVKFRTTQAGTITGDPLLQGHRQHRDPCWLAVVRTGTKLGECHVHRRDLERLAGGDVRDAGRRHRQYDLRGVLLRAGRPLLGLRELLHLGHHPRPADGPAERDRRSQRRLPIRHHADSRTSGYNPATTGSTSS